MTSHILTKAAALLLLLNQSVLPVAAHFEVVAPSPLGTDDTNQNDGPCGGFSVDVNTANDLQDFHVGGEAIAVRSTHSQSNWLFRATLDPTASGDWVQIFPIVQQSGLGAFCQPQITLPADFAGKKGVVSIVGSAQDGLLYSCIAANFIEGTGEVPSTCQNATGLSASFTSDSALEAQVGNPETGSDSDSDNNNDNNNDDGNGAGSLNPLLSVAALAAAGLGAFLMI